MRPWGRCARRVGTRLQNRHFSAAFAGFGGGIRWLYRDNEAERVCFGGKRGKTGGKMRPIIRYRALRSALGVNWMRPPDSPRLAAQTAPDYKINAEALGMKLRINQRYPN
jgi:hypothetical protein